MNISKSLMAILLVATLMIGATSINNAAYAAETRVGADIVTTADPEPSPETNTTDEETDEVTNSADLATTSGDEVTNEQTKAIAPPMPDALKANYATALKSISSLNKVEAVSAAINDVATKIPKFKDLVEIEYAIHQVKGFAAIIVMGDSTIDPRATGDQTTTGPTPNKWTLIDEGEFARNQLITALATQNGTLNESKQTELQSKTFLELINLGKADSRYVVIVPPETDTGKQDNREINSDHDFSALVDSCQSLYDEGVATLNKLLPVVGASTVGINSMNGESLASLATSVGEYDKYGFFAANYVKSADLYAASTDHYWELFPSYINANLAWFQNQGKEVSNYNTDTLTVAYGRVVAAAKAINPEFNVDLSKVTTLKTLPTLPNTGSLQDGDNSASVIALALGGIAATVTLGGLGLTVKRFCFSPLKRRR